MKEVEVALALWALEGRTFLQRRDPGGGALAGLWEFPGGKVQVGESLEGACRREFLEEVGLTITRLEPLPVVVHDYPQIRVRLHPFRVMASGLPRTHLAWGWFTPGEVARLPLPEANQALLGCLP